MTVACSIGTGHPDRDFARSAYPWIRQPIRAFDRHETISDGIFVLPLTEDYMLDDERSFVLRDSRARDRHRVAYAGVVARVPQQARQDRRRS